MLMKQSHDSSDDWKFENFYVVTDNTCDGVQIPANLGKTIFWLFLNYVVPCSDNNVIKFYAYSC